MKPYIIHLAKIDIIQIPHSLRSTGWRKQDFFASIIKVILNAIGKVTLFKKKIVLSLNEE